MGKLVRDEIPALVRADGREARTKILSDAEYRDALFLKLEEEAAELRVAQDSERLAELADLLEVVGALTKLEGFTVDQVEQAAALKRQERGGFESRVWLDIS